MKKLDHSTEFDLLCQMIYHRQGLGQEAKKQLLQGNICLPSRKIPASVNAWRALPIEDVFYWGEEYGGIAPNSKFNYNGACAITCSINGIPKMKNPFVVALSGQVTAPFYALDAIRYYAEKYHELLPFIAIGNSHDVIFDKLYCRRKGIFNSHSEADIYYNIMSKLTSETYARKYQQEIKNFVPYYSEHLEGLHHFALAKDLDEVTFIICSGQASYDRCMLSRWLYLLNDPQLNEVKINLVVVKCPTWLNGNTPDNKISEISLGRVAHNIGEMVRGTTPFRNNPHPYRYNMCCANSGQFTAFEDIIKNFNCFGHPQHSHELYGTKFNDAIKEVFKAVVYAAKSYSIKDYEEGIMKDIEFYQSINGKFTGETEEDLLKWCISSPKINFWAR